jgi:hypothetical protein
MSDAATPAVPNDGTPPVAPAATPAAPAPATPEMVSLTKEAHDQLARDAARASANQRKADLFDRIQGGRGNHFKPAPAPAAAPSPEEAAQHGAEEDRKAERGLLALAADPAYREALDADPTLRDLLTKNPLAVLPVLAADALDADDAISLVKEALNKRKPVSAPATPAVPPAPAPVTPPVGPVNTADQPVNEEVELARKNPNPESAIAGMIGARLRGMKK